MGCSVSRPPTTGDADTADNALPHRTSLAARLSAKAALRESMAGERAKSTRPRYTKAPSFKPPLPATPENGVEDHGALPELHLSMDSISSAGSNVGTAVSLGQTGLTRSTGGSDALSRSTASTIGAKSQDAKTLSLSSMAHRLSQASTVASNRISFDTTKTGDYSLDTASTTPFAAENSLRDAATLEEAGTSEWHRATSAASPLPSPRHNSRVEAPASTSSPHFAQQPPEQASDVSPKPDLKGRSSNRIQFLPASQRAELQEPKGTDALSKVVHAKPALSVEVSSNSRNSLDSDGAPSARAMSKSLYYNINANMYHRPTYERDAVDDEFAAANGLSLPRFIPRRSPYVALGGTVVAENGGGHGSFQAYSTEGHRHQSNSIIMNADVNDLGLASPLASPSPEQRMGSLTGWQAIAAQIMEEGEVDDVDRMGTDLSYGTNDTDSGDTPRSRQKMQAKYGSIALESPTTPKAPSPSTPKTPRVMARFGSIVDMARRQQQARPPTVAAPAIPYPIAFQPGGGFYVQYECLEKLGAGAFGEAVKARRRKDGQMFVVKMMHSKSMTDKAKEEARNEVHVLATLNHPNIVKYYESFLDNHDGRLLIVMELCEEGDLDVMLKRRNGVHMSEDEIMMKFVQICLGLLHVHNKGIIHRDLKTNNIFCCNNGIVKLGDFGISKMLTGGEKIARTMVGTPYYMSPEIIKGRKYDAKTDVWAVGCVLYELCALRKAFDATNLAAITVKVMSGKIPPIPAHYSSDIKDLIHKLIQKKPDARPELSDILGLAFVRRHLVAYEKHILKYVNIKQRESFVASLAQYMPEHAQLQQQVLEASSIPASPDLSASSSLNLAEVARREGSETSITGRRNSSLVPEEGRRSFLAVTSRASSATERSGIRNTEVEAMVRELRAREEAASREKLRAFKAQRPRAKSKTTELPASIRESTSAPDLLHLDGQSGRGASTEPAASPMLSLQDLPALPPITSPLLLPGPLLVPAEASTAPEMLTAEPLELHQGQKARISMRSAGTLLGDIKAILQQPEVDKLEPLGEEQSVIEEASVNEEEES